MKILLLLSISLISINAFSSDLGEDKKSPCPYVVQSSGLAAKPEMTGHTTEGEQVESEIKAIRK